MKTTHAEHEMLMTLYPYLDQGGLNLPIARLKSRLDRIEKRLEITE